MRSFLLALTLASALLGVRQAVAHAFLHSSTPAVGSTVATPPSQVVIDFTEGVEPRFSSIAVTMRPATGPTPAACISPAATPTSLSASRSYPPAPTR